MCHVGQSFLRGGIWFYRELARPGDKEQLSVIDSDCGTDPPRLPVEHSLCKILREHCYELLLELCFLVLCCLLMEFEETL